MTGESFGGRANWHTNKHIEAIASAALHQGIDGGCVNFVGDEGKKGVRGAYPGATWDRLRQVKKTYDPGNAFRLNQNIPPAT